MTRYYFTTVEDGDGYQVLDKVTTNPENLSNELKVFYDDTDLLQLDIDRITELDYPIYTGNVLEVLDINKNKYIVPYEDINSEYAYYNLFEELDDLKIKEAKHVIHSRGAEKINDITTELIDLYNKCLND